MKTGWHHILGHGSHDPMCPGCELERLREERMEDAHVMRRLEAWLSAGKPAVTTGPMRVILCGKAEPGEIYSIELYEYPGNIFKGLGNTIEQAVADALDKATKRKEMEKRDEVTHPE